MANDVVNAEDLIKRYRGKETPAVDGISFDIAKGETIGLLGPNGAGKTTLMKMICGVTPPTTGKIRVFGADPSRDPVAAKTGIGAMHQSAPYDEMLSALDNLQIATRFKGLSWRTTSPWAMEVAEYLGLKDALSRLVFQLSGGSVSACSSYGRSSAFPNSSSSTSRRPDWTWPAGTRSSGSCGGSARRTA